MTDGLIAPHGEELIVNKASELERSMLLEHAKGLMQITVGSRQLADLEDASGCSIQPIDWLHDPN